MTASKTKYQNFSSISPQNSIDEAVKDFEKINLYSKEFLQDLWSGLERSSYSKTRLLKN